MFFFANKLYKKQNLGTRSVAWAEVDIVAHPSLAVSKETDPTIFIMGVGIMRKLNF